MRLKNGIFFWTEALTSLMRNRILSLATITTTAICILILGIAVLMSANVGNFMDQLESDVQMRVFLNNHVSTERVVKLGDEIKSVAGVSNVTFVSKDEGLKQLNQKLVQQGYNPMSEDTLGENPLPDTYIVQVIDPQQVNGIALQIEALEGVNKVRYGQDWVEKLFSVSRWIKIVSFVLIGMFAFGAIFLISTTIRLAIFSRRKEVFLMKLVGATDWFIRWPFFIEGILLAGVGSLVAVLALMTGYQSLLSNMKSAMYFIPMVDQAAYLVKLYVMLMVTGVGLGILGTYISLNRFLDV